MADMKISQLAELEQVTGQEMVPVQNGTGNNKVSLDTIRKYAEPDLPVIYATDEDITRSDLRVGSLFGVFENDYSKPVIGTIISRSESSTAVTFTVAFYEGAKYRTELWYFDDFETPYTIRKLEDGATYNLQLSEDNTLQTTDKTVAGAINEVKATTDSLSETVGGLEETLDGLEEALNGVEEALKSINNERI